MKSILLALTLFCVLLPHSCTKDIAGNSTQTGNPAVVGTLYEPDGHTPAANATVTVRKRNSLADTSGSGPSINVLAVTTNDSGKFSIDSIQDGLYSIEATKDTNAVLIDSVSITAKDTVRLGPDTLRPTGKIVGVIKLAEGGDPRKVFIQAYDIDRFGLVNADGSFAFSRLARGTYHLRFTPALQDYDVLEMPGVKVGADSVTDLDTVEMPFSGIPVPRNVKINYDTLKQIVTLTWSKEDTSNVEGYNIYRRNSGDAFGKIPLYSIRGGWDSCFSDSTVLQDMTYEYKVISLDKTDVEGMSSEIVSVNTATPLRLIRTIQPPRSPNKIVVKPISGLIYVLCWDSVLVIDSLGTRVSCFLPSPLTDGIGCNLGDSLFTVFMGANIIKIWDPLDSLCGSWVFSDSFKVMYTAPTPRLNVRALGNADVCVYDEKDVIVYSSLGTIKNQHIFPDGILLKEVKSEDTVFVYDSIQQKYELLNKDWQPFAQFTPPLGIYNKDQRCCSYNDSIIVISGSSWTLLGGALSWVNINTGALVARLKEDPTTFDIDHNKRIFVNGSGSTIKIYDGRIP